MKKLSLLQFLVALFILAMAIARIIIAGNPDSYILSNFTPIGAMALFGGVYFKGGGKFYFPLITLWISDIFLNRYLYFHDWVFFYEGFWWVYAAFALMVVVGKYFMKKVSPLNFIASTLAITFIHWIVTDLGVFLGGTLYPMTWSGWWACLLAAIPFELNFLIGTLFYGGIMFSAFELVKWKMPALSEIDG